MIVSSVRHKSVLRFSVRYSLFPFHFYDRVNIVLSLPRPQTKALRPCQPLIRHMTLCRSQFPSGHPRESNKSKQVNSSAVIRTSKFVFLPLIQKPWKWTHQIRVRIGQKIVQGNTLPSRITWWSRHQVHLTREKFA